MDAAPPRVKGLHGLLQDPILTWGEVIMANVKGTAVKASVIFVQERLGIEGYGRVVGRLPPEARETFEGNILPSSWYPFAYLRAFMEEARKEIPTSPGRSIAWEMGRFSADHGLNSIYRVFFKVADPGFIIRKGSQVLSTYYDSGKMEPLLEEKGHALLRLTGFDEPHPLFCDRLLGWMERTLELCGASSVQMSHPRCLSRGDASCDYEGRWR